MTIRPTLSPPGNFDPDRALDPALLDRYWSGEATGDERRKIEQTFDQYPEERQWYQALHCELTRDSWQPLSRDEESSYTAAVLRAVGGSQAQAGIHQGGARTRPRGHTRVTKHVTIGAMAAALAGVVAIGISRHQTTSEPTASTAPTASRRYQTHAGQTATVTLADGSTMTVGPATTVTVTPSSLDVDGEAYFVVVPRANRPFVVRTSNAVVRVLGTRFGVRQYAGESHGNVVVEDGRVALGSGRQKSVDLRVVLAAGMAAQLSDTGITVQDSVVVQNYVGWTQGDLVFDRVPLREVAAELSRAYGVRIRVADSSLAREKVSVEVKVHRWPLTQVLDAIGAMLHAHVVQAQDTLTLSPGRAAAQDTGGQPQRNRTPQLEKAYGR